MDASLCNGLLDLGAGGGNGLEGLGASSLVPGLDSNEDASIWLGPSPGLPLLFDSDPLAPNYHPNHHPADEAVGGTEAVGQGLDAVGLQGLGLELPQALLSPPPPPPPSDLAAAATQLRDSVGSELEHKRAIAREKNRLAQRRYRWETDCAEGGALICSIIGCSIKHTVSNFPRPQPNPAQIVSQVGVCREKGRQRAAEEQAQAQALQAEMAALRLENAELAFSQRLLESMLAVRLRLPTCACACPPAPAPFLLHGGGCTA
jgi:hypothetical protein